MAQYGYARDEDGDGFHEIQVKTIEGFWPLLRSCISDRKIRCLEIPV